MGKEETADNLKTKQARLQLLLKEAFELHIAGRLSFQKPGDSYYPGREHVKFGASLSRPSDMAVSFGTVSRFHMKNRKQTNALRLSNK